MMSEPMQLWTLLFGAATIFLVLVQVAILGGLVWAFRLFQSEYRKIQRSFEAEGIDPRQVVSDIRRTVTAVEKAATKATQLADSASEVMAKAHQTVDRIDSSLDSVVDSVGRARASIQHGFDAPVQEYRAITAALRCALGVLRRHPQPQLFTDVRR
jgi:hypothetical protein